ncbi:MAG: copper oxidase, partial [Acidobacteriota bacterium]
MDPSRKDWGGKSGYWLAAALFCSLATASVLDNFGPPPAGDPSEFTGPLIGEEFADDFLASLEPANEGAFDGGATGTFVDPGENNSVPEDEQLSGGKFDVPTGGPPSPLFGAGEFEQQMLRFEEFGTEQLAGAPLSPNPFPPPTTGPAPEQDPFEVAASVPAGATVEAFLAQAGIAPFPTVSSNVGDENPWRPEIEDFLGRALDTPPAEGRPPGKGWSHQRWNEFTPQVFFKTDVGGSRVNGGFRDSKQMHTYSVGEFAPGGLYHRVYESSVAGSLT